MLAQITYFLAIKYSNAATATILQFTNPILVAIALSFQTKKFPSPLTLFSIFIAFFGVFLIVAQFNFHSLAISPHALFWGIISAFAAAFYILYARNLIKKYGEPSVVGWAMLLGGIVASLYANPFNADISLDIYAWGALLFVIIFGTAISFYIFLSGAQKIGAQKATILSFIEPAAAVAFTIMIFDVKFTIFDFLGSACIIAAVICQAKSKN
jgi:drug/metabolite transporter (DMT)-like permease